MSNQPDHEIKEEKTHDHDHKDHDHNDHHEVEKGDAHKSSRGEKKFKKAMIKMGLKPVDNINRVTLRTSKNFLMYIDEPFVMKSSETSYVIFGEAKILDFKSALAGKQAEKFQKAENVADSKASKLGEVKEEDEEKDEEGEVDIGDLKEEDINSLISYSNCSRNKAIRTLKKTNGDVVEAITLLSS